MISKILGIVQHLFRGDLIRYIRNGSRYHWRNWVSGQWDSKKRSRAYVDCWLQWRVKMRLYPESQIAQGIYTGTFETGERKFLNAFLRPRDIFVDVGANIGLFSLIAARRVGSAGRVFAFEPCSLTYERLLENQRLNNFTNLQCYKSALSDTNGAQEMMTILDGGDMFNSLAKPYMEGGGIVAEKVETVRWTDFAK